MKKLLVISSLFIASFLLPTIFAQTTTTCAPSSDPRVTGLVTTPDLTGKFYTDLSGKCIVDDETKFTPFSIENLNYDDLLSLYFDQYNGPESDKVKIDNSIGEGGLLAQLNLGKKLIYITGNLGMNGNLSGTNTSVVFIDGYLYFASPMTQFTYGNNSSGIVFVVNGDVFIDESVTTINAVIISSGTICTAAASGNPPTCPSGNTSPLPASSRLVINGSLVSLNKDKPIRFRRTLTDNSTAAEQILHQPKYLVILRNIFAQTLQRWSEIP